jgi:hypothetical protein
MSISDGIKQFIIATSTFAQVIPGSGPGVNIIGVLIVWRFIAGVAISIPTVCFSVVAQVCTTPKSG